MIKRLKRARRRTMHALRSFDDRSGSVAVEFALILPVTALMLAGLIEFGVAVNNGTSLENGARAGAQFALEQGLDAPGIQAVVANASNVDPDPDYLTVEAQEFWECSDSWGTKVPSDTDCGVDIPLANFIEVHATYNYEPIFPFLQSLTPAQIDATATVRVP
jgi:Flp pilus assembly protein TadG